MKHGGIPWVSTCLGVAMDGDTPVVVRAVRTRNGIRFTPIKPGTASLQMDTGDIAVCACLTARKSFARWVQTPFAQQKKAIRVLPTMIDIELPFALEDCIHEVVSITRDGAGRIRGLVVGARKADITATVEQLGRMAILPAVLDHEGLALWSGALSEHPAARSAKEALRAIIHLGSSDVRLVVGRGDELLGVHTVRMTDIAAHIAQLVQPYVQNGERIDWLFAGPGAEDRDRQSDLRAVLVEQFPGTCTTAADSATFLARAVARRALTPAPLACNLLAGAFEHPLFAKRRQRQTLSAAVALLLAGISLSIASLSRQAALSNRAETLDTMLQTTASRLAGYPITAKGDDAYDMTRRAVEQQMQEQQPFLQATRATTAATLAKLLPLLATEQIKIGELRMDDTTVTLSGVAPAWKTPEALVATLKAHGFRAELSREDALDDGTIPFSITSGGTP